MFEDNRNGFALCGKIGRMDLSNNLYRELWDRDLTESAKRDILVAVGCNQDLFSCVWDELPIWTWQQLVAEFAEFMEIRPPRGRIK